MLDPQFLAQIRSYLNESGNQALDAGIGSLIAPQAASVAAPQASKSDSLTSGIQRGIGAVMGHVGSKRGAGQEKANMNQEWLPVPTQMVMPPAGYRPGYDPEWNYGIGNPQSATAIRAYNQPYASVVPSKSSLAADAAEKKNRDRERTLAFLERISMGEGPTSAITHNAYGNGPSGRSMENGMSPSGAGGLGGLLGNAASYVKDGISNIGDKIGTGISSLGSGISKFSTTGKFAEGGEVDVQPMDAGAGIAALQAQVEPAPVGGNEKDLISQAVSAIKGEVEDPRPVLAAFVQKYGEDALRNLVDKVESGDMEATAQRSEGHLKGPGDGMSDMIPASVDGSSDVLLSDGEYVVPADVVSGLGNGSSDAGAKHLDEMMSRVRQQRTGSKEQAQQINPKEALPV